MQRLTTLLLYTFIIVLSTTRSYATPRNDRNKKWTEHEVLSVHSDGGENGV